MAEGKIVPYQMFCINSDYLFIALLARKLLQSIDLLIWTEPKSTWETDRSADQNKGVSFAPQKKNGHKVT